VTVTVVIVSIGTAVGVIRGESASVALALSSLLLYGGLFASANVLEAYLRARRRLRRIVAASVLEKYVLVMLLILVATTGTRVWEIGVAYVAAGLLRLSLLGSSVFGRTRPPMPDLGGVRAVLRKSLPFALTSGAITVVPMLDTFVLLAFSATAAGYFALGVRVLGPAVVLAAIGAKALYPFLARRLDRPGAIGYLTLGFAICGGVLAVVGYLAAPVLVPAVFGHQYEAAVPAVQVMLLSLPFAFATNPLLAYSFSSQRERAVVAATIGVALVGTGAIIVGQVSTGVTGAALGALLRQVILLGALAWIAFTTARSGSRSIDTPVPMSAEVPLR
jgi:O-antigen/teichoic acid export membrane protein